jgi:ATP/maltotriose-dependent transcriptional regulator MalT
VSVLFSRRLSLLYRGRSRESCEAVTRQWPAMLRSLQTQNQQTRVMLRDVRARAAVQAAPGGNASTLLARARRDLRSLGREGTGWTDAVAARLRGCIAIADGDPAGAIAAWRQALPGLESAGLAVQAAVLRRRLGETLGGDEGQSLVRAAETVLRERGIPDIIAVTRMYS